jgi:NAD-dependent dihydropyrimidine dehydrogenase PreA subunit
MIRFDNGKCLDCGVCLRYRGGYCLEKTDRGIAVDHAVCNDCGKCVALCPGQAFSLDGAQPVRIAAPLDVTGDDFMDLLRRRRSIRHFLAKKGPRELLGQIAEAAGYAPTMNKAIEAVVIDDSELIGFIDKIALRFITRHTNSCSALNR